MAVTKIWDVRGRLDKPLTYIANPDKTLNPKVEEEYLQALADVIAYAAREDKTEQQFFVSAVNCNTTYARRQFQAVKEHFDKAGGIVAYHAYQSFAPGETTPEEAHRIGMELAEELWGDRFQVVVATHLNTECLHNHFVINSVSYRDGRRYHDCKETYRNLRETSDRICREHGLSIIEKPSNDKNPTNLYRAEKAGMPTRYNVIKAAIDEAVSCSYNMKEFDAYLKRLGYTTQFNPRRKYWTVIPKGWDRPVRLARLGEDYTNDRIFERVTANPTSVRMQPFQPKGEKTKQYLLVTRKERINKVGGLRGLYLKYCYELGYLPKYRQSPNKVHYYLKADLMKCEMFSKQARLLGQYGLMDKEELAAFIEEHEKTLTSFDEERNELRRQVRRVMPEEEKQNVKGRIDACTKKMKCLRDELKLAKDILMRSSSLEEKLELARQDIEQKQRREMRR